MRIGIQGQPGSACDEAAAILIADSDGTFDYLTDAAQALAALKAGLVDKVVLAAESPLGTPVHETDEALSGCSWFVVVNELNREVRHCIMVLPDNITGTVERVASHAIPLEKHRAFLSKRFPGYVSIILPDPGMAAQKLSIGELPRDTAVIAMPRAAEVFGLKVLERELQPMTITSQGLLL